MNKPTDPVLNLIKLLDRPIAFHRCLAEVSGSALSGLLLSQALYWQGRANEEEGGWWYKTREQWRGETMMTRSEQETARRRLRDSGILEEERRGIPAKLWFRVNLELLANKLAGSCQQGGDIPPTGGQNPANIYTENTAETKAESDKKNPPNPPKGEQAGKKPSKPEKATPPDYSPEFEAAWKDYPARAGDNPKPAAWKAWTARLNEGHTTTEMHEGAKRYAAFIRITGKEGTEFVKHAATFFGPSKPFLADWTPPPPKLAPKPAEPKPGCMKPFPRQTWGGGQ